MKEIIKIIKYCIFMPVMALIIGGCSSYSMINSDTKQKDLSNINTRTLMKTEFVIEKSIVSGSGKSSN